MSGVKVHLQNWSGKKNILCIVPPYSKYSPPAAPANLLGFLESKGVFDFDFLDLRLGVLDSYAPTYRPVGRRGESFVIDVPDLPLILEFLRNCREGRTTFEKISPSFRKYCADRNIQAEWLNRYLRSTWTMLSQSLAQLKGVEFVGFTVWTSNLLTTLMASQILKQQNSSVVIVCGGPQVSESWSSARIGLRAGLWDAVVVGEGEQALFDLYERYRRKESFTGTPGVQTSDLERAPGRFQKGKLLRLSEQPLPAFHKLNLAAYKTTQQVTLPFRLSRGCTDKCTFCSEWIFWERFRTDEVRHVMSQLRTLKDLYSLERITFTDSLLNGHPHRLIEFAESCIQEKLGIEWGGYMRAEMNLETARKLKRAGCSRVFLGVESMNDSTLALMNKRRQASENYDAIAAFLKAGIKVRAGVIPGFPGDTDAGFRKTMQVLRRFQNGYPKQFSINVEPFVVTPGQPLFDNLKEKKLQGVKWDELTLNIEPRFSDIAEKILCRVTGENQGSTRRTAYGWARNMANKKREPEQNPFSYHIREKVTETEFRFEKVKGNWWLAQLKLSNGRPYGLIVNAREKKQIQKSCESGSIEAALMGPIIKGIEESHVVPPRRGQPRLRPGVSSKRLNIRAVVRLNDYSIAREDIKRGVICFALLDRLISCELPLTLLESNSLRSLVHPIRLGEWIGRGSSKVGQAFFRQAALLLGREGILEEVTDTALPPNFVKESSTDREQYI